ncbi:hypothetical protein EYC84_001628 [Monilinia fructicola]|uniref:Uncharacterized protein n=1 Tax=Monilinia fructicola TaxID=38448 RepID=A0A5M9JQ61_MONFR|nr:hypothetical protein EYC84_001628 [Monilinia fructicola]
MSPLCSFLNNRDENPVIHLFFLYSPCPALSFPSVMVSLKSMHATTTKSQKSTIHVYIGQHKTTNIKPEELGCMTSAKFKTDLSLISMAKTGVFNLTRNLV